jgi:hypothetical protein
LNPFCFPTAAADPAHHLPRLRACVHACVRRFSGRYNGVTDDATSQSNPQYRLTSFKETSNRGEYTAFQKAAAALVAVEASLQEAGTGQVAPL